jgi:ethanolamine transporter EutH
MTLLAGLAGGLAGVLWSGLVTAPWLARGQTGAGNGPVGTAARLFADALLRAAAGAALGFLFWLGWGLIAVVGSPWYATGLLFGALCWAAIAAPVLATLLLHGRAQVRPVAAHAVEWLVTCLGVGLLCAFAWHRYA